MASEADLTAVHAVDLTVAREALPFAEVREALPFARVDEVPPLAEAGQPARCDVVVAALVR